MYTEVLVRIGFALFGIGGGCMALAFDRAGESRMGYASLVAALAMIFAAVPWVPIGWSISVSFIALGLAGFGMSFIHFKRYGTLMNARSATHGDRMFAQFIAWGALLASPGSVLIGIGLGILLNR